MKTIQQGNRTMYQCEKCSVMGSEMSVIELGYCHRRTAGHHAGKKTSDKKLEQKHKIKGMSKISVKKFNSYDGS